MKSSASIARPKEYAATDEAEITPETLMRLLDAVGGIGRSTARAAARVALGAMIDHHPASRRALVVLGGMAADAGTSSEGREWTSVAYAAHEEYDQLLALGAASSWADPAFLLDPDGAKAAEIAIYLRIARARLKRGNDDVLAEHVAWLEHAAAIEGGPEGRASRRATALESWPFNANGDMDGPSDDPLRMILGSLTPIEIQFRGLMAAIRSSIQATPDDLRRARALALRLLEVVQRASLRMSGLAHAALASIYLTQARVAGKRLPGLEGRPARDSAGVFVERAGHLLHCSQQANPYDHRGLAALRGAIDVHQAMASDGGDAGVPAPELGPASLRQP